MVHLNYRWVVLLSSVGNIVSKGCSALSSSSPQHPLQTSTTTSTTTPKTCTTTTEINNDDNNLPPYLFPNSLPISPHEISTFQRQTGQIAPSRAAVSIPAACRCRHGFPQAFAMDPVPSSSTGKSKRRRINSGMVKLTCPRLVRAVDRLEDEGMIQYYNHRLRRTTSDDDDDYDDDGVRGKREGEGDYDVELLRESVWESHRAHAAARTSIISHRPGITDRDDDVDDDDDDALSYVEKTLGPHGSKAFLSAGVAGATGKFSSSSSSDNNTEIDVKCLHAWLADYLFRGEDKSLLGAMVAQRLATMSSSSSSSPKGLGGGEEELFRGGIEGTVGCHVLCDPKGGGGLAEPPMPRNKQRKKGRKEKERRRRRRMGED